MSDENVPDLVPLREDPTADPRLREMFALAHRDTVPVDLDFIADAARKTSLASPEGMSGAGVATRIAGACVIGAALLAGALWFREWTNRAPHMEVIPDRSVPASAPSMAEPAATTSRSDDGMEAASRTEDETIREPTRRPRRGYESPAERTRSSRGSPEDVASNEAHPEAVASAALAEGTLLLRARRFLGHRDPEAALAAIREHETRFPNGRLASERDAIAIDALRALGRDEEARGRARRLLTRDPTSPYADRARSVLAP